MKIKASLIVTSTLKIPKGVQESRNVWDINEEVKKGLYRHHPSITREVDMEITVLKDTADGELHVSVAKWRNKPQSASWETSSVVHLDDAPFQTPKQ